MTEQYPYHYNPSADSELQDLLRECFDSTRLLCKTFFPERFHAEFSKLHDEIFEAIDSDERMIVIAAPRGIGKTSIAGLGLPAREILYREASFIPYVSLSATSAELQTENLKIELASNQIIQKLFGKITTKAEAGLGDIFSKKTWIARLSPEEQGTLILPRGSGQQVRGLLYRNSRPDRIIIDDLEDPETMENDEVRRKRKEWFFGDLLKCVSRVDKNWRIIYIDTLKHEDALLQHLLESKEWYSIRQELFDDNYHSNAPEFISDEEIAKDVEYYREQGMMDVLYREYRNIPISLETMSFDPKNFQYYREVDNFLEITREDPKSGQIGKPARIPKGDLINLIIIDPAKTVQVQNADTAIICVGISRSDHKIFFRDCVSDKLYPDQIYKEACDMAVRFKAYAIAPEVTSLHQFISQPLQNYMRTHGVYCQYIELKAVGHKAERVKSLVPYYRQRQVFHNPAICTKLESQLTGFPRSRLWDVMDAFGYAPKLLDELDIFFDPDDDVFDPNPDDYNDLNDDEPDDEWRLAI